MHCSGCRRALPLPSGVFRVLNKASKECEVCTGKIAPPKPEDELPDANVDPPVVTRIAPRPVAPSAIRFTAPQEWIISGSSSNVAATPIIERATNQFWQAQSTPPTFRANDEED